MPNLEAGQRLASFDDIGGKDPARVAIKIDGYHGPGRVADDQICATALAPAASRTSCAVSYPDAGQMLLLPKAATAAVPGISEAGAVVADLARS